MKSEPTPPITKGRPIARWAALRVLAISSAALLFSCATPRDTGKQEALVCPQCRTVEVQTASARPHAYGRYPSFLHGPRSGGVHIATTYEHHCEGCQGVLSTFFREGKFQHKCSICNETPFSCPVIHPITAGLRAPLRDLSSRCKRSSLS
jgi:hypothetical protein